LVISDKKRKKRKYMNERKIKYIESNKEIKKDKKK